MKRNLIVLISCLTFFGCKDRNEVLDVGEPLVNFSHGVVADMPTGMVNSEKRSQGDLDCDGIEDMFEINDTKFFGQEYKMNFYKGKIEDNKRIFEKPIIIDLGIKLNNWSSQVKMDSAHLNKDQCIDIVFVDVKKNQIRMEVAMNQGNFLFTKETKKMKVDKNINFLYYFKELIEEISLSEDESLSDYLKMDWADWDGNGTDDFHLFVKDGSSLDIGVFLTENTNTLIPKFKSFENVWVQDFLYHASIRELDTGDLNGDGKSDIAVYLKSKNKDNIHSSKYAIAIQENGELSIQQDKLLKANANLDFFKKVTKRDIVDENNDGFDDLIYITEVDGVPSRIIWYSKPI